MRVSVTAASEIGTVGTCAGGKPAQAADTTRTRAPDARPQAIPERPRETPAPEELRAALEQLAEYLQSTERHLQFRVDEVSGRIVVSVVDAATGESIRQIPTEEALRLARQARASRELESYLLDARI